MSLSDKSDSEAVVHNWTDTYFLKTRQIVEKFGDMETTYAIFMRRPVIFAPRLLVEWLEQIAKTRKITIDIQLNYREGEWVGAGEPLVYLTGPMSKLVDLETLYLQKLGPVCVTAWNAYTMAKSLPHVAFMAMDCRHCAGLEMADMMAYAAFVGSTVAQKTGAKGFIANATNATAHYFGQSAGWGTMPHALIGYAKSTLRAAEMFAETFPEEPITVLVDYFGKEISDSLTVCRHFQEKAAAGEIAIRLDTHGGRFAEGLDPQISYAVLERHVPDAVRRYRSDAELRHLTGTGVSAASLFHLREKLDEHGFDKVKIIASSGFNVEKCQVMSDLNVPVDVIGTGSFLPTNWSETYATADIVAYDGVPIIKVGREFLLTKHDKE